MVELVGGGREAKLGGKPEVGVVGVPGGESDMIEDAEEGGTDVEGGVAGTTSG
jgi:hypothetical protein